jgi:WD40 repeat protein
VGGAGDEQGEWREQRGDQGVSGAGKAHGRVSVSEITNRAVISGGLGLLVDDGANSFGGVAFGPDGHTLATAGDDEDVRLWDLTAGGRPTLLGSPLTEHSKPVSAVAFSAEGRFLATGSQDGTARLWELNPGRAIRRICAVTKHTLTEKEWRQYVGDLAYRPPCP